jgi:hypothetical protein
MLDQLEVDHVNKSQGLNRGQCANPDIFKLEESLRSMARSVRVEFPGHSIM